MKKLGVGVRWDDVWLGSGSSRLLDKPIIRPDDPNSWPHNHRKPMLQSAVRNAQIWLNELHGLRVLDGRRQGTFINAHGRWAAHVPVWNGLLVAGHHQPRH